MSRAYDMSIELEGFSPSRADAIRVVLYEEWTIEDELCHQGTWALWGKGSLLNVEREEEFADRIARAVMTANGGPCVVRILATNLENAPRTLYTRNRDDYARLVVEQDRLEDA
ncbi:MAG: hypothetical protein IMZ71_01875 [Chloroflexi bacterium]|nr:hypothetical protein [Chloroflexota bacterium]